MAGAAPAYGRVSRTLQGCLDHTLLDVFQPRYAEAQVPVSAPLLEALVNASLALQWIQSRSTADLAAQSLTVPPASRIMPTHPCILVQSSLDMVATHAAANRIDLYMVCAPRDVRRAASMALPTAADYGASTDTDADADAEVWYPTHTYALSAMAMLVHVFASLVHVTAQDASIVVITMENDKIDQSSVDVYFNATMPINDVSGWPPWLGPYADLHPALVEFGVRLEETRVSQDEVHAHALLAPLLEAENPARLSIALRRPAAADLVVREPPSELPQPFLAPDMPYTRFIEELRGVRVALAREGDPLLDQLHLYLTQWGCVVVALDDRPDVVVARRDAAQLVALCERVPRVPCVWFNKMHSAHVAAEMPAHFVALTEPVSRTRLAYGLFCALRGPREATSRPAMAAAPRIATVDTTLPSEPRAADTPPPAIQLHPPSHDSGTPLLPSGDVTPGATPPHAVLPSLAGLALHNEPTASPAGASTPPSPVVSGALPTESVETLGEAPLADLHELLVPPHDALAERPMTPDFPPVEVSTLLSPRGSMSDLHDGASEADPAETLQDVGAADVAVPGQDPETAAVSAAAAAAAVAAAAVVVSSAQASGPSLMLLPAPVTAAAVTAVTAAVAATVLSGGDEAPSSGDDAAPSDAASDAVVTTEEAAATPWAAAHAADTAAAADAATPTRTAERSAPGTPSAAGDVTPVPPTAALPTASPTALPTAPGSLTPLASAGTPPPDAGTPSVPPPAVSLVTSLEQVALSPPTPPWSSMVTAPDRLALQSLGEVMGSPVPLSSSSVAFTDTPSSTGSSSARAEFLDASADGAAATDYFTRAVSSLASRATQAGGRVIHGADGRPAGLYFQPRDTPPSVGHRTPELDAARHIADGRASTRRGAAARTPSGGVPSSLPARSPRPGSAAPPTPRAPRPTPYTQLPRRDVRASASVQPAQGGVLMGGQDALTKPPTPLSTPLSPRSKARLQKRKLALREEFLPPVKVLIVEDNVINQRILATFLRRKRIAYDVANDGREAIEKWREGDFHLLLMDIQLPVLDGIAATKEIRRLENLAQATLTPEEGVTLPVLAARHSVIIVALTASVLNSDRVEALAAGCNDFLNKPVSLPWLQRKILEWGSMQYLLHAGLTRAPAQSVGPDAGPLTPGGLARAGHLFREKASERSAQVAHHLRLPPRVRASPARPAGDSRRAPEASGSSSAGPSGERAAPARPTEPPSSGAKLSHDKARPASLAEPFGSAGRPSIERASLTRLAEPPSSTSRPSIERASSARFAEPPSSTPRFSHKKTSPARLAEPPSSGASRPSHESTTSPARPTEASGRGRRASHDATAPAPSAARLPP